MLNIYKLIEHVVHNMMPLNEYSEATMKKLIDQFKEEADDFNIEISDKLLTKYIKQFDNAKQNLPADDRDITKWSLKRLMRYASNMTAEDEDEEWDPGLDVIYDSTDGNVTVWNGNTEDRCIRYARNESPWCIGRGSFKTYHLDRNRGYPTFYLLRNRELDATDYKNSFIALQVRDPEIVGTSRQYVFTNRNNSPYESDPMAWEDFTRKVKWVERLIPNAKEMLKHQPLSPADKKGLNANNAINIDVWKSLPLNQKKDFLAMRKSNPMINNMDNIDFLRKYIAPVPALTDYVTTNPEIFTNYQKLRAFDSFSKSGQKSILANMREVDTDELYQDNLTWKMKQLITYKKMWGQKSSSREIFLIDNDTKIVDFRSSSSNFGLGVVTEHEEYRGLKFNKRTVKFLRDAPNLTSLVDKTVISILAGLDPEVDKKLVKALESGTENGVFQPKTVGDLQIFTGGRDILAVKDGKITKMTEDEYDELRHSKAGEGANEEAMQALTVALSDLSSIDPEATTKRALYAAVEATPLEERPKAGGGGSYPGPLLLDKEHNLLFIKSHKASINTTLQFGGINEQPWNRISGGRIMPPSAWPIYFEALEDTYSPQEVYRLIENSLDSSNSTFDAIKAAIDAGIPTSEEFNAGYRVTADDETITFLNLNNRTDSKIWTRGSGNPRQIPQADYNRLVRAATGQPERARPTGDQGEEPAAQQPAQALPEFRPNVESEVIIDYIDNIVGTSFTNLPANVRARLTLGAQTVDTSERGARLRNQLLAGRGDVSNALRLAGRSSAAYIIRLDSGTKVISIAIQPGNIQGLITSMGWHRMGSANDLVATLNDNNINEDVKQVYIREFLAANPSMKNEVKAHLQKHLAEKKKPKANPVEALIKEAVKEYLNKK